MKEKIMLQLRAKFKNAPEAILDRVATRLAKTVTKDEEIEAAVTAQTESIEDMIDYSQKEGDRRVTEALKKREAELKAEHAADIEKLKLKPVDTKPVDTPTPPAGDTPEWAKELKTALETNTAKLTALENEKVSRAHQEILVNRFKDKVPEKFYRNAIAGRTFKDESEIETFAAGIEKDYTDYQQEQSDKGLLASSEKPILGKPGADGVSPATATYIASQKAKEAGAVGDLGGKKL